MKLLRASEEVLFCLFLFAPFFRGVSRPFVYRRPRLCWEVKSRPLGQPHPRRRSLLWRGSGKRREDAVEAVWGSSRLAAKVHGSMGQES